MTITREINGFQDLQDNAWSGAVAVLEQVEKKGKEDEVLDLLEEIFFGYTPTETEVNDFIWFDLENYIEGLWDEEDEEEEEGE